MGKGIVRMGLWPGLGHFLMPATLSSSDRAEGGHIIDCMGDCLTALSSRSLISLKSIVMNNDGSTLLLN